MPPSFSVASYKPDRQWMIEQAEAFGGYDRISGALSNVGYNICDSTIGNILKAHGIEPAPDRRRTGSWETFLKAHWDVMAAIDFTTVEVRTKGGLTTFYLLFVMELKTRRVAFAGCTTNPNEAWMKTVRPVFKRCPLRKSM